MTSVLIALDEPFVQMGVRVTIENTEGFEVAGVAEAADQIVPTVAELAPDILILDSHFQQADDKLLPRLVSDHPECKILVMVDHTDEGCTPRALLAGPREHWLEEDAIKTIQECCLLALRESARGCLPKGSTPERLIAALQAVAAGEVWTGPGLASYWMHSIRPPDPDQQPHHSPRTGGHRVGRARIE